MIDRKFELHSSHPNLVTASIKSTPPNIHTHTYIHAYTHACIRQHAYTHMYASTLNITFPQCQSVCPFNFLKMLLLQGLLTGYLMVSTTIVLYEYILYMHLRNTYETSLERVHCMVGEYPHTRSILNIFDQLLRSPELAEL